MIAHFLDRLFPGMEIVERSVFRVTRDADFEVSDDADDLLEAVEQELQRRRFGDAVRLEISSSTSRAMLERLQQGLGVGDDQVYEIHGLLDLAELEQLLDARPPGALVSVLAGGDARAARARRRSRATSSPRSAAATSSSTSPTSRSPAASRRSSARRRAIRT